VLPGWYPDPWGQAPLRWWDGFTWTAHLTSGVQATPQGSGPFTPSKDLRTERQWSRFGRWAFVLLGIRAIEDSLYSEPRIGRELRSWFHGCRAALDAGGQCTASANFGIWNYNLLFFVPQIVMIVWLYQVASVARRLNIPARHSPGWAIGGFLVPIVNFWFPYQVARDCFLPQHPGRSTVAMWWGMTLGSIATGITVVLVAALSGRTAGTICGAALLAVPVWAAVSGYRMVQQIE